MVRRIDQAVAERVEREFEQRVALEVANRVEEARRAIQADADRRMDEILANYHSEIARLTNDLAATSVSETSATSIDEDN